MFFLCVPFDHPLQPSQKFRSLADAIQEFRAID